MAVSLHDYSGAATHQEFDFVYRYFAARAELADGYNY
jgi:hypothetical protein